MSSPVAPLLALLDEEEVAEFAARLRPHLAESATAPVSDGWLRGAERIAAYIDATVSRVYALSSAGRIPLERDGSNLIARKSELDAWIRAGGGKRP